MIQKHPLPIVLWALLFTVLLWASPPTLSDAAEQTVMPIAASFQPSYTVVQLKHHQDCDVCPVMVDLPADEYQMGVTDEDREILRRPASSGLEEMGNKLRLWHESPRHKVRIKAFAMAEKLITREEFSVFVRETGFQSKGCKAPDKSGLLDIDPLLNWEKPGFEQSPRDPVVCVSRYDANKYIDWLNHKLTNGSKFRLPTEEEWEYAARAGTSGATYWGSALTTEQCKYVNARDQREYKVNEKGHNIYWHYADCDDGYVNTSPVDAFPPNPWGLYDMLGNVSQWTSSLGPVSAYILLLELEAQLENKSLMIVRGSDWRHTPEFVRISRREDWPSSSRYQFIGIRVAQGI